MTKEEKLAKLKIVMKGINKTQKKEVLSFADTEVEWVRVSTGIKELDDMIGGGFPRGHTSIVWGGAGSAKSTLMYSVITQAQKDDLIVVYLDLENSFSNGRAKAMGVNVEDLVIGHYNIAEEALDTIVKLAKEGVVDVIILDSIHCYDKETMILTDQGWKFFKDLTGKELVISLNKDNETTKYVKINKIIKHYHKGKMYKYEGKHCNFCMTSNNSILFGNPTFKYKFSGWLKGTIKEAIENWKYNYFLLKKNFVYKGMNPRFIEITGKKHINHKKLHTYRIKTSDWCDFLGWWLSEGSSGFQIHKHSTKKQCVSVKIHQSIKSPFLVDIEKTLDKLPFVYKKYIYNDEVTYTIHNTLLGRYLIEQCITDKELLYNNKHRGGAKIKKIPENVKKLSKKHLLVFLDAYYKGDGWLSWNGNKCISTSSYQMALDLKEIYLKTGNYVNIITEEIKKQKKWIVDHWATLGGKHYTLTPYTTNLMSHLIIKKNIKEIDYNDYIYDVEIEAETHLIYLMRKGTSYWASNSMATKNAVEDKKGDKSLETNTMGALAKKLSEFFARASTYIFKSDIALIMVGQVRKNLGGFVVLDKLSGGNALIHNSVLTLYQRRGQKSNAPVIEWREAFLDPDGKFHLQKQKVQDGFETVIKIDKKKCSGGKNEGSTISLPYYYDTGFIRPESGDEVIKIDPTMNKEQVKIIKEKLEAKGYAIFTDFDGNKTIQKDLPKVVVDGDGNALEETKDYKYSGSETINFDSDNNCAKDAQNELDNLPLKIKKKRGSEIMDMVEESIDDLSKVKDISKAKEEIKKLKESSDEKPKRKGRGKAKPKKELK